MDPETLAALQEAATRRAGAVAARADRPSHRRSAPEQGASARVLAPASRLQLAAADTQGLLHFSGYASVTERGYDMWDWYGPYTEVVAAGAFAASLARDDLDVPLVLQHSSLRRIARTTTGTLTLLEDETGLLVDAPALDAADQDVAYIAPKLRAGLIDEMSFMFRIVRGQWSPDYTEYRIQEVDLHRGDVAIVGYGANPYTVGAGLRSADALEVVRSLDDATAREALTMLRSRLEPSGSGARRGRDLVTSHDTRLLELV